MAKVERIEAGEGIGTGRDLEARARALDVGRTPSEIDVIHRAFQLAREAHRGQTRVSGEPYVEHALAVAQILSDLRLDHEVIAAAILHDVVEDTSVTLADITQAFGERVARLVDGVTRMDVIQEYKGQSEGTKKERADVESLRKMLLAMAEDVHVVLIKLADRLHNMRTLGSLPPERQQRIARETMDIFAPLANRLGIWQVKWELEDLAFRYLQPERYRQIAAWLAERRVDREQYIAEFAQRLSRELVKVGVHAEVTGRPKHIYGIWRKMQRKGKEFHEISDVRAVRVLVDTVPDCYAALGVVHTLWPYIPGEFDDYIATPKENNYRSIHTAVIGPGGKTVEVQIRTSDMHNQAELGIAAHWRYKEEARPDEAFDRKIAWLRQLLDWKEELSEASEFVDHFKSEVFEDRVYVFTPKGNVIDLPQGATPLDFAYDIHTEVGHRCRGAKVNGHIVPLTYALKSGERVEILTVKKGGPSRDWLNPHLGYLKTSKARSKVQQWFRQQDYEKSIAAGRDGLERELRRLGLTEISYDKLAQYFKYDKVEEFLAAMGRGDLKSAQIIAAIQEVAYPEIHVPKPGPAPRPSAATGHAADVHVQGVGNLMTHMARCCKPVPGDPIVGYITRGQGVSIHRQDCPSVLRYNTRGKERLVEVSWGGGSAIRHPVDIRIIAYDRQALLRDITALLANEKVNVIAINTATNKDTNTARMIVTLEVPDISTLSRILARIEQIPNVTEARRWVQ